jgi:hypothetical protein
MVQRKINKNSFSPFGDKAKNNLWSQQKVNIQLLSGKNNRNNFLGQRKAKNNPLPSVAFQALVKSIHNSTVAV